VEFDLTGQSKCAKVLADLVARLERDESGADQILLANGRSNRGRFVTKAR
jgi:hypothetical protein